MEPQLLQREIPEQALKFATNSKMWYFLIKTQSSFNDIRQIQNSLLILKKIYTSWNFEKKYFTD